MDDIYRRTMTEANLIVEKELTVRAVAKVTGVSKSTVFRDMRLILPEFDLGLYEKVDEVLLQHKKTRHINGGAATRRKFKG